MLWLVVSFLFLYTYLGEMEALISPLLPFLHLFPRLQPSSSLSSLAAHPTAQCHCLHFLSDLALAIPLFQLFQRLVKHPRTRLIFHSPNLSKRRWKINRGSALFRSGEGPPVTETAVLRTPHRSPGEVAHTPLTPGEETPDPHSLPCHIHTPPQAAFGF